MNTEIYTMALPGVLPISSICLLLSFSRRGVSICVVGEMQASGIHTQSSDKATARVTFRPSLCLLLSFHGDECLFARGGRCRRVGIPHRDEAGLLKR